MTLKELSQLYHLTREIETDKRRLQELSDALGPSTAQYSDMPRAPFNPSSKTERLAAEIVDLQAIIAARQIQCIHERARLERWVNAIPNSVIRQIFLLRFADGLSWVEVAEAMGDDFTEYTVKQRCYRYLRTGDMTDGALSSTVKNS